MLTLEELNKLRGLLDDMSEVPGEFEERFAKFEEECIQNEIVPAITEAVEPVLKQLKRGLLLIVDYSPEDGVKVKVSERRSADGKRIVITPNATSATNSQGTSYVTKKTRIMGSSSDDTERQKATVLKVTFPDGTVIEERSAKATVIESIKKIGIQEVADLCYSHPGTELRRNGVNLVGKQRNEKYADRQTNIGGGWLMFDNTSTEDKRKQMVAISESLGLKLKVEVVPK